MCTPTLEIDPTIGDEAMGDLGEVGEVGDLGEAGERVNKLGCSVAEVADAIALSVESTILAAEDDLRNLDEAAAGYLDKALETWGMKDEWAELFAALEEDLEDGSEMSGGGFTEEVISLVTNRQAKLEEDNEKADALEFPAREKLKLEGRAVLLNAVTNAVKHISSLGSRDEVVRKAAETRTALEERKKAIQIAEVTARHGEGDAKGDNKYNTKSGW
ncbi:hypothetical protein KBC31_00215 [Candidatus Saccharibacteria bacterium]|nr:hypothetical protein [Candidatus Saccharibacteria bacterium]